jgi:hypothetical protein
LKNLLIQPPDRYATAQSKIERFGKETRETRSILCWYRNALLIDGASYSLLVRIREQITYPSDWSNRVISMQDIKQDAALASWWCKRDK